MIKKITNWIKTKTATTSTRKQRLEEVLNFLRSGFAPSLSKSEAYELYNINPDVGNAIDLIAEKLAEIEPVIKTKNNEIITTHPVLELLKRPNPYDTYFEFMEAIAINFLIHNNSFYECIGFTGAKPKEIHPMKNTWVSITEGHNKANYVVNVDGLLGRLSGNFVLSEDGRIVDSGNLQEIRHLKGFALSRNGLSAASKLLSLQTDAELVNQSGKHNLNLLKEGFNGAGLFSVDTQDPEVFEQFKKDVLDKLSGSGNSRSPLVARSGNVDFKSFGQSNKDMEYSKTRLLSQQTIYKRYKIPGPLIDNSSQTFNNYQTAEFSLYHNASLPLLKRILSDFTLLFQDRNMLDANLKISFDESSIPALQLRRNEEIKLLRQSFMASTNELRSMAGREAMDDSAADIVFQPANLVPLATDSFTNDNLKKPSKSLRGPSEQLIKAMKEFDFSEQETKEFWNEYQEA